MVLNREWFRLSESRMRITLLVVSLLALSFNLASCQSRSPSDVRLPPTIITGPDKGDYYRSDDEFTLQCKARGVPEVSYQWKKNGMDLNLNGRNVRRGVDGTITIDPATSLDGGFYQCVARNQFGTALSNISFMQMVFLDSKGNTNTPTMIVKEGEPFCVEAHRTKTNPMTSVIWKMAIDTVDKYPASLLPTKRMQIAENSDLCFAYAKTEDDLGTKIYKITEYDEQTDTIAGGSYTKVNVTGVPGGPRPFSPTLSFSSQPQTIAVEGRDSTLWCFFAGNPEPDLAWSGPRNTLPIGRFLYVQGTFKSRITIQNVQPSDEGDYICSASNTMGINKHTMQMRVEAVPRFLSIDDQPHDTNVTDGASLTFKCYTYAKPEATVVWLRNGQPLDLNQLPRRYRISNDKNSLTIENLCRDCTDRSESISNSDLGVLQCNASNRHGYAFGTGYVNVLLKTSVIVVGEKEVSVDMREEKNFTWQCTATSDPSTPPQVRWFKETKEGDEMVYEEPPVLLLRDGILKIHVVPNKTQGWEKYQGKYRCDGENGYTKESVNVALRVYSVLPPGPPPGGIEKYWWIILLILLFLLLVLLVFICYICRRRKKRDSSDDDIKKQRPREAVEPGTESSDPLYDTINDGFESVQDGHHLRSDYMALTDRDLAAATSTYAELRSS